MPLVGSCGGGARRRRGGSEEDTEQPPDDSSQLTTVGKVLVAALVVGFLTGFLGVGGGFIIVPALVLALRYEMPVAVGTSLVVISITSLGAFVERLGTTEIPWLTIIPFTAAAILGSFAGKHLSDRVTGTTITRAFAALLVLIAIYVAVHAGTSL